MYKKKKGGFKLVIEMCNHKESHQIFKNNKVITIIYINDEKKNAGIYLLIT